jgi:hypothetical protein
VCPDGCKQIRGAPVMQKENALSHSPQRCSAKLVRASKGHLKKRKFTYAKDC